MFTRAINDFIALLDIELDAFAICEIENGSALRCRPSESPIVHFVLQGSGAIEWEGGTLPIEPSTVVVFPKNRAKQINSKEPIQRIVDADLACPLGDGLVAFRAIEEKGDLILGCALLRMTLGEEPGLLDRLSVPLVASVSGDVLPLLFRAMLAELCSVETGTRTIVAGLMKQIMVLLLRSHLEGVGPSSELHVALTDPRLARVIGVMKGSLAAPHTLDSLARTAGMSRSRFSHHFATAYGCSPMQFLQAIRIERAARMLEGSDLPTKTVAATVGYSSRSSFSRVFRSQYGVDPSRFRDDHRRSPTLIASARIPGRSDTD